MQWGGALAGCEFDARDAIIYILDARRGWPSAQVCYGRPSARNFSAFGRGRIRQAWRGAPGRPRDRPENSPLIAMHAVWEGVRASGASRPLPVRGSGERLPLHAPLRRSPHLGCTPRVRGFSCKTHGCTQPAPCFCLTQLIFPSARRRRRTARGERAAASHPPVRRRRFFPRRRGLVLFLTRTRGLPEA